jgi:hypothetical protein
MLNLQQKSLRKGFSKALLNQYVIMTSGIAGVSACFLVWLKIKIDIPVALKYSMVFFSLKMRQPWLSEPRQNWISGFTTLSPPINATIFLERKSGPTAFVVQNAIKPY